MAEFGPDNLPDNSVSDNTSSDKGFGAPKDFDDQPVSPVNNSGGQKDRMGMDPSKMDIMSAAPGTAGAAGGGGLGGKAGNLANAAGGEGSANDKAQEAGRQALKSATSGGGAGSKLPGGDGPILQSDREADAQKSNTEKNIDAGGEAVANYFAPGSGVIIEKAGGVRGVTKKAGGALVVGAGVIAAIISIVLLFVSYLLNGGALDAMGKIITDPMARHFAVQAVTAFSGDNGFLSYAAKTAERLDQLGDGSHPGATAARAADVTPPEPGSLLDKISKIDWDKAKYQTLSSNDCPYTLVTKITTKLDGKPHSVPDYVLEKSSGKHISFAEMNDTAGYCVQNEYPLLNMFVRQPIARQINTSTDVHLNYAAAKDAKAINGSSEEINKYVYGKTIDRVTPSESKTPDLTAYKPILDNIYAQYNDNVNSFNPTLPEGQKIPVPDAAKNDPAANMKKMYDEMTKGTSPYDLEINNFFNIPTYVNPKDPNNPADTNVAGTGIATGICPFVYTFMDTGAGALKPVEGAKNARIAIETRLAGAERNAMKFLTLGSTRKADQLNTNENNASLEQVSNWASSTGYQLNVYGQLGGQQMNPEGTHNRAYNAKQSVVSVDPANQAAYPALAKVRGACYVIGRRGNTLENGPEADKTVNEERGIQANRDMIDSFNELKKEIVTQSPGVFTSPTEFGLEQIMTGFIRTGSATAVSGLEPGPDNFNRQMMGISQLTNDYSLRQGGRFLSDIEAKQMALKEENTRRDIENKNGIAYRLFNTNNSRSLASIIAHNTTTKTTAMTAMLGLGKQIINPLSSLANINSGVGYFAMGAHDTAYAADITSNDYFKIETAAVSDKDLNLNILENATIIEKIKKTGTEDQKRKLAHYDECFKTPPPTKQYFNIETKEKLADPNAVSSTGFFSYILGRFATNASTGNKINFFSYFPEKNQEVTAAGVPVGDDPDSAYNKYLDCKTLFVDATDFNNAAQQLPIRYRVYTYNNSQLDLLDQLSSDDNNSQIYANSSGRSSSGGGNNGITSERLILPVDKTGASISQCWGVGNNHDQGGHPGIDIAIANGSNVYAVADGEVIIANNTQDPTGYGKMVYLKHSDTLFTLYGHNQELIAQEGSQVRQGDIIAKSDTTGYSTGPHLHFEVRSGPYGSGEVHNPIAFTDGLKDLPGGNACKEGPEEKGNK